MAGLSRAEAHDIASAYGFPLDVDFHTLRTSQVESVIAAADAAKYRQPKNANGSRARYFHARLVRASQRERD